MILPSQQSISPAHLLSSQAKTTVSETRNIQKLGKLCLLKVHI